MPTPFTHLATAQRLLADPALPPKARALLHAQRPAFLLGSVAADARVNSGSQRADTHFYRYEAQITERPWRVMLAQHPVLQQAKDAAQAAFLAGYVGHLAVDEYWSVNMLLPHFHNRQWGTRDFRYFMLHILLVYMDERDLTLLEEWQPATLSSARPDSWLPFMPDATLRDWRDFIAGQIVPGSESRTLQIFGARIHRTPADFRAVLDEPKQMQSNLWQHIPPEELARIEHEMYAYARAQMIEYAAEFLRMA